MASNSRADYMRDRLNDVFAQSDADLDFITLGIGSDSWRSNARAVIWSEVKWCGNNPAGGTACHTDSRDDGRTWEVLEKGWDDKSKVTTILTITDDDVTVYGLEKWEIALRWANNIRFAVNGWNCSKSQQSNTLVGQGFINQLLVPSGNYHQSGSHSATRYGTGEQLPHWAVSSGEIFHTNDLTIAVPSGLSGMDGKWVRISYGSNSVVVRATDRSGGPIDLSAGGAADYLGFPGSGSVDYGPP